MTSGAVPWLLRRETPPRSIKNRDEYRNFIRCSRPENVGWGEGGSVNAHHYTWVAAAKYPLPASYGNGDTIPTIIQSVPLAISIENNERGCNPGGLLRNDETVTDAISYAGFDGKFDHSIQDT